MRLTKLVCTLGPASAGMAAELVAAGMDVARVNFSHASPDELTQAVVAVRAAAATAGRAVGILAGLAGPKVRLGEFSTGQVRLVAGKPFRLRSRQGPGDDGGVCTNHPGLAEDLRVGDCVVLADGAAELQVLEITDEVVTEIVVGGTVRSRAGVNVPSARISLPPLSNKDRRDVELALALEVDFIAQSLVQRASDVRELRSLIAGRSAQVVAKLETRAAIENADAIMNEADAVMVARGDLGVELPLELLPVVQKDLLRHAAALGVPAIVATEMLESMTDAPKPTRAEASDVANAVLDGADAIMLSAETAIGRYPVEATRTAARIAELTEAEGAAYLAPSPAELGGTPAHAVARAATAVAAANPETAAIACFTRTGRTAALLAAARPRVPVFAFCPDRRVVGRLTLSRAVMPLSAEQPADTEAMIALMDRRLATDGLVPEGRPVVIVASTPVGRAHTNLLKLHRVGEWPV